MKIKFDTYDNLLLNKPLNFHMLAIIVWSVFKEDSKFYAQICLDERLYELETMMQLHIIEDSEGIDLNETDKSKECKICYYSYFNNGFKSDSKICNDCDWGIKYFGGFGIIHVNGVGLQIFYVRYD